MTHVSTQPFLGKAPPRTVWPMPLVLLESTSAVSIEYIILTLLGFTILAIILYFVHTYHQKKALEEREPLERPSVIFAILSAALDSRSRIDIFLANGVRLATPLAGFIEKLEAKSLFINMGKLKLPEKIRLFPLLFYFQLGSGHDKVFYSFTGSISEFSSEKGLLSLQIPVPKSLTNAQKRDFVRINPGPGMVEALVVWKVGPVLGPGTLPASAAELGSPHFSYRPPKSAQVALVDISGGGALLRFAGEHQQECGQHFSVGDTCCLLILLHDLDSDKTFTVWLAGTCRRTTCNSNTANMDVALQFTHWAQVEKATSPIHWNPVQREGEVPAILTWTLKVHTFLTRKSH